MAIQMDFEYGPACESKRRVYRVLDPDLTVRFTGQQNSFSIVDLGAGGMSIQLPNEHGFGVGWEGLVTFQIRNKLVMPRIMAKILRFDQNKNTAAFEFISLNGGQAAMLNRLILALQKYRIRQKNSKIL